MKVTKITMLCLAAGALVLTSCNKKLESDKDKYSYALGFQFAKNIKAQNVDADEKAVLAGIKDALSGKTSQLTDEQIQAAMQKMYEGRQQALAAQGQENKKRGEDFLKANLEKEGVKATASGLQYKVVTEGSGAKPKETSTVSVHYRGTLLDGTEFDSSYKRNQPAEFPLKGVIPGWTEALQLMNKGSKYELYIPSNLAYGDEGRPGIPPSSTLIFEVELLEVK